MLDQRRSFTLDRDFVYPAIHSGEIHTPTKSGADIGTLTHAGQIAGTRQFLPGGCITEYNLFIGGL
jgi:hypothetical protein